MLLEPSPDQEVFRQATARFLADRMPVDALRRLRAHPAGFEEDYWRRGAELGWTSLLIDERFGGGTISGQGLVDLSVLAYEFGTRAAPGPLLPTNAVAAALSSAGDNAFQDVLDGIASGASIAAWCLEEPVPNDLIDLLQPSSSGGLQIRTDGTDIVLDGLKRPVESAGQAAHLLVTGRAATGLTQVLVPADTPGITVTPMKTVDLTRRFCAVHFDGVRLPRRFLVGELGGARPQVERQLQVALVIANADAVGALQTAFDMTVQWAFDRYSFGRPLASYQALKHRFADMLTWLQVCHALSDAAAVAVDTGSPEAGELASAAKAYIGQYGGELIQDCVQLHGGIGVTFEHDIHLYLRRHTVNRALFGTPAAHRQLLATAMTDRRAA